MFRTSNSEFIQKCGLDAYFFLRYLRMLLKIFIPSAIIVLPILLPINAVGGKGPNFAQGLYGNATGGWVNVTGLDQLAWGNVQPTKTNRYWAHLIMAVGIIIYCCFIFFDELRGFIRLRQAYLTSPQHRLRASATTVLVTAIPRKWCTAEALEGLYDVFPGGIRNIWINRDYDRLNEKVELRTKLALKLESAETDLIKKAKKANMNKLEKEAKKTGQKRSKQEKESERKAGDDKAAAMAGSRGVSTGNPHQVRHTVDEALNDASGSSSSSSRSSSADRGQQKKQLIPVPLIGQGLDAVGQGLTNVRKTVFGGLKAVGKELDDAITTTQGFQTPSEGQIPTAHTFGDGAPHADGVEDSTPTSTRTTPRSQRQTQNDDLPLIPSTPADSGNRQNPLRDDSMPEGTDQLYDNKPTFGTTDKRIENGEPAITKQNLDSNQETRLAAQLQSKSKLQRWRQRRNPLDVPSPIPHGAENNEFPFDNGDTKPVAEKSWKNFWKKSPEHDESNVAEEYPIAYDDSYEENEGEPAWKKYLRPEDRDTMRLPAFGISWLSWVPFIGAKVDTIDYCRKEVARLNLEIETDQKDPAKFPLMNSAFIQFNHQVAAHMACQSVSHHIPSQMAPRLVEIAPDDVIWSNMSIKWWERYIRTFGILIVIVALILGWAIPVAFTGTLSNISVVAAKYQWLNWITTLPDTVKSIIQGILPPLLLAILLALLPIILRFLTRLQGLSTGMAVEIAVQNYYFAFLFVQVFLVITASTALPKILANVNAIITTIPNTFAQSLPMSANYFFSYLILQALSNSAGTLVQVMGLIGWFILAPLLDSTARQKWKRQISLPDVQWGTFFPVYSNLAVIGTSRSKDLLSLLLTHGSSGLIYSVVAPLILVFNIITFSLFWFVFRYNTLYVTKFRHDTGGLLFPQAINHLFVGLYVMEIALIGLFFIQTGVDETTGEPIAGACVPQGVIMIVVLIFTALFQWLLNRAFRPLFTYLPITLEDDAVIRDEEFARAQEKRFNLADEEQEGDDINDVLEERERRSQEEEGFEEATDPDDYEKRHNHRLDPRNFTSLVPGALSRVVPGSGTWAERTRTRRKSSNWAQEQTHAVDVNAKAERTVRQHRLRHRHLKQKADAEAQVGANPIGDALFADIHDEIEDLTPEERDILVQRAFQHEALRARRPVIWIPRDDLGVSDDEVARTKRFSEHIWISNEYTALDSKARVVYRKSPPDFSEVDLIEL